MNIFCKKYLADNLLFIIFARSNLYHYKREEMIAWINYYKEGVKHIDAYL